MVSRRRRRRFLFDARSRLSCYSGNQPVEITVVNRLGESTALHWHGMELDSFYDGVHGWSGTDQRLAPIIEPEHSFVVRFTPPRTGTFMYHTHCTTSVNCPWDLYGPMIVVDSGETFDPATDHVLMVGRSGLDPAPPNVLISTTPVVLNGESAPRFAWKAGDAPSREAHQHHADDIFTVSLQTSAGTGGVDASDQGRCALACRARARCNLHDRRLPWAKRTTSNRRGPGRTTCGSKCAAPREVAGAGSGDRQVGVRPARASRAAASSPASLLAGTEVGD